MIVIRIPCNSSLVIQFANTYHLLVHPGTAIVEAAGGLHEFMSRTPAESSSHETTEPVMPASCSAAAGEIEVRLSGRLALVRGNMSSYLQAKKMSYTSSDR